MQCTSISVVSAIDDLDYLEDIREFIENRAGMVCIDMTTSLEENEGLYRDCVVAKDGPILLTKEPLIWMPNCMKRFLSSTLFHILSAVTFAVAIPLFALVLFVPDESTREIVFCCSTSLLILVWFLNIAMFKSKIFLEVVFGFEFWYLVALQCANSAAGAYLFTTIGINIYATSVLMFLVTIGVCCFAFGIDASPFSRKVKTVYMSISFLAHLFLFLAARFLDSFVAFELYNHFINDRLNLVLLEMSPQEIMISALISLMMFYVKYAALLGVMGQEFIMVWAEAKDAQQEIGEIKTEELSLEELAASQRDKLEQSAALRNGGVAAITSGEEDNNGGNDDISQLVLGQHGGGGEGEDDGDNNRRTSIASSLGGGSHNLPLGSRKGTFKKAIPSFFKKHDSQAVLHTGVIKRRIPSVHVGGVANSNNTTTSVSIAKKRDSQDFRQRSIDVLNTSSVEGGNGANGPPPNYFAKRRFTNALILQSFDSGGENASTLLNTSNYQAAVPAQQQQVGRLSVSGAPPRHLPRNASSGLGSLEVPTTHSQVGSLSPDNQRLTSP